MQARHVRATWGRRCDTLLFMSSAADPELPAVRLNVSEGRDNLWAKTKNAFKYVHRHHLEEADWFVKADDDTYMIIENLRLLLSEFNATEPLYFGRRFKPFVKQGYMSGGAGYVLSKEALKRFVEVHKTTQLQTCCQGGYSDSILLPVQAGVDDRAMCRQSSGGAEDVEMGQCMQHLGVTAADSRDQEGKKRFFPFVPEHHLIPGHIPRDSWYWRYQFYAEEEGLGCCSDRAVSFHYVSPREMYLLEYLIYHLRYPD